MKMLLTSGGVTNASIRGEFVRLLGKPIEESTALLIPTAQYAHPMIGPAGVRRSIVGEGDARWTGLGWREVGHLELTTLPSLGRETWEPWVRDADALLVHGGDAPYLAYWVRRSGLLDVLPTFDGVWVGLSSGSMVMTPRIGSDFTQWRASDVGVEGNDGTLGFVDFAIFPHLDHPMCPENTLPAARQWADEVACPAYAVDDDTAFSFDALPAPGANVEPHVVSEGQWHRLR